MAKAPLEDNSDDKPLDPAVEKVRRKLVRFVGINLGLLFVALMAVVGAIVYKSRTEVAAPGQAGEIPVAAGEVLASGEIVLPAGARIVSHSLSGNRMSIEAELAGGARAIFVYDLATGRMLGRFDLAFR